jgi:hypothetical protein
MTLSGTATVYYVVTAINGRPLMVQVVLLILKPAGSVGATVQLAIAPPELLKVMSLIAEPIVAIWSTAFAILGAAGFTVKGKIIMSIFEALFTITVYTVVAFTSVGVPLMAQVALSILKPAGSVGVVRLPVAQ